MPTIQVNDDYFETIDTEQKAYWLGFLYADGYAAEHKPWTVILQSADIDHVQSFADAMEYTGTVKIVNGSGFNPEARHGRLVVCRKKMCQHLSKLGRNLKPMTIPDIPQHLIRHFIRGYFDGDGSIHFSRSTAKTTAGNRFDYHYLHVQIIGEKPFLQEIADYLLQEGISTSWKDSKTEWMKYLCVDGGHNLRKLHTFMYQDATIQLPRKAQKWEALYAPSSRNAR